MSSIKDLSSLFYYEFNKTMNTLKSLHPAVSFADVPLPEEASNFVIERRDKVVISGIETEYYSKLNNTENLLWGSSAINKRKFDYNNKPIVDKKTGKIVLEDVPCPRDCVGVVSNYSIGVPNKFQNKEGFKYVDMVTQVNKNGEKGAVKFIYIIPKKYCYKMQQTALVMSWERGGLRKFYSGVAISTTLGRVLYLFVVPYKPNMSENDGSKKFKVLCTKTDIDYTEEMTLLRDHWINCGFMFNPDECKLDEPIQGRDNMASISLDANLDDYIRFDTTKPMSADDGIDVNMYEEVSKW